MVGRARVRVGNWISAILEIGLDFCDPNGEADFVLKATNEAVTDQLRTGQATIRGKESL